MLSDLSIRPCFLISRGSRFPIPRVEILRILENSRDIFYIVTKDTTDKVAIHTSVASNKTPLFFSYIHGPRAKLRTNGSEYIPLKPLLISNDESKAVIIAINRCGSFFAPIFSFSSFFYQKIHFKIFAPIHRRYARRKKREKQKRRKNERKVRIYRVIPFKQ